MFYSDSQRRDGMSAYCKECMNSKNKKWREANRDVVRDSQRNTRRKREYGVDRDMFQKMLLSQGGLCAICKTHIDNSAHVDHCHDSGTVRGLLCHMCNVGIGFLRHDEHILRSAIDYIKK